MQTELPRQLVNQVPNTPAQSEATTINNLTTAIDPDGNFQMLVIPLQQQAIARLDLNAPQAAKTPSSSIVLAKMSDSRSSLADQDGSTIEGAQDLTLRHSDTEPAATFEHTDYVAATRPSVSIELAVGYAIAVFHAAQLATKSIAAVGSNVIHSPVFAAAYLDRDGEAERGHR
jgi:hypothetical protein